MSAEQPDPLELRGWTRTKWWAIAGLILALHLGLIFWLAAGPEASPASTRAEPSVELLAEGQMGELPAVLDATLFVLPNRRGFSEKAWLRVAAMEEPAEAWEGPTRLLALPVSQLGGEVAEMVRSNLTRPAGIAALPEPLPEVVDFYHTNLAVTESTLAIEGDLRSRRLALPVKLDSQSSPTILSNTVMQIVVDSDGRVYSPPILLEKSGSDTADAQALALANSTRFAPAVRLPGRSAPRSFTAGRLVYRWHTVIVAPSNSPPALR